MDSLWLLLVFVLLAVVVVIAQPTRTIVFEYERGLKFRRGRFKGVLDPGLYWYSRLSTQIQRIDVRPARVAVAGRKC